MSTRARTRLLLQSRVPHNHASPARLLGDTVQLLAAKVQPGVQGRRLASELSTFAPSQTMTIRVDVTYWLELSPECPDVDPDVLLNDLAVALRRIWDTVPPTCTLIYQEQVWRDNGEGWRLRTPTGLVPVPETPEAAPTCSCARCRLPIYLDQALCASEGDVYHEACFQEAVRG